MWWLVWGTFYTFGCSKFCSFIFKWEGLLLRASGVCLTPCGNWVKALTPFEQCLNKCSFLLVCLFLVSFIHPLTLVRIPEFCFFSFLLVHCLSLLLFIHFSSLFWYLRLCPAAVAAFELFQLWLKKIPQGLTPVSLH